MNAAEGKRYAGQDSCNRMGSEKTHRIIAYWSFPLWTPSHVAPDCHTVKVQGYPKAPPIKPLEGNIPVVAMLIGSGMVI
jgi:hypothetical protein